MSDFQIVGADSLVALSKSLKGWDDELRKQMKKDLVDATKPLIPEVREAIRQEYPKRGGLSERMAKARIRGVFQTGRDPGVKIVIAGLQIKLGEVYGIIRHPVYADKKNKTRREWAWAAQEIPPNKMQERVNDKLELIVPGVVHILEKTAQTVLDRGVR